jgi:DNA-binding CsgD family transcriptional regulator
LGDRHGGAVRNAAVNADRKEGPFDHNDKNVLAQVSQRLTETATLSKGVGRLVLSGMTNALQLVKQPALALDRMGFVIDMNAAAEQAFDADVSVAHRRLRVHDKEAKRALDIFIDRMRIRPDTAALPVAPIMVRRRGQRPLIIRMLPVDGAARSPFLGARALLLLSDLAREHGPQANVLVQVFGLSPAEARLAMIVGSGESPERAAEQLGIARETARNQLKAVFAKTDTHRQSELVALLARI